MQKKFQKQCERPKIEGYYFQLEKIKVSLQRKGIPMTDRNHRHFVILLAEYRFGTMIAV